MKRIIKKDGFHRTLEGWPLVFTILTTVAILIGGLVEFLPLVLVDSAVERIERVDPWTPLELEGRDIYIAEGCNTCHSQMVRPFRHEIERYGEYSKAGETIYERPFLWGSKRTGPDLARVGGKYPHLWHVRHMENPRSTSPRSIMPPYPHMLENEMDLSSLPNKIAALTTLGTPYGEAVTSDPIAHAEAQAESIASEIEAQGGPKGLADKDIVAIVAYLQRLGTDIQQPANDVTADDAPDDVPADNATADNVTADATP